MPFHWRFSSPNLLEHFPGDALGVQAWRRLIERLNADDIPSDACLEVFDEFLATVSSEYDQRQQSSKPDCQVFVTHQQRDVALAERVAYLATVHGFDYWLDVHDPTLALANRHLLPTDPRYGIIIAAIIEIGLLNSSHVVAVHTANSLASKWVPYEFGRAKARRVFSSQAAGWFAPSVIPAAFGEYVQLAVIFHGGETGLDRWLVSQSTAPISASAPDPCKAGPVTWSYAKPAPLP